MKIVNFLSGRFGGWAPRELYYKIIINRRPALSNLAEYARRLHEGERRSYPRGLNPARRECAFGGLKGVRAAIF